MNVLPPAGTVDKSRNFVSLLYLSFETLSTFILMENVQRVVLELKNSHKKIVTPNTFYQ